MTVFAALSTLLVWSVTVTASLAIPSVAAADNDFQVHDTDLEPAIDFYQYIDNEGGIHFVDSPEKIPARYRLHTIVRKDTPAAQQTTKIAIVNNEIHVPVVIRNNGQSVHAVMLLDTGAAMTSITPELAARLGIDVAVARPSTTRLADGSSVGIRLARIDALAIGTRQKNVMEIAILAQVAGKEMHDGLLGLDFLSEFQYQIDFPASLIRWQ